MPENKTLIADIHIKGKKEEIAPVLQELREFLDNKYVDFEVLEHESKIIEDSDYERCI